VTLETAGGPPQSLWSPPSPHIPEQSWQEPPPPFLGIIFSQNHHFSKNNGPSTLTYIHTYNPHADNNNDATTAMTMDAVSLNPHSSTASALLHPPSSHDLASTEHGCNLPLTTCTSTQQFDDSTPNDSTGKMTTATLYTSTPTHHTKTTEKDPNALLHIYTQGEMHHLSNLHSQHNKQVPVANPASITSSGSVTTFP